jgi:short-subunit dehydrogenase
VAKVSSLILFHKPDVLILNAAQYHAIEAQDEEGFQYQLQLNLLFPLQLIHRLQTSQINWKLKVVYISSIMTKIVDFKNPLYAASKAALSHYIEGSRTSLNPNLSFLNVYPGPMNEELNGLLSKLTSATYSNVADVLIDTLSANKKSLYIPALWRFVVAINSFLPNQLIVRR